MPPKSVRLWQVPWSGCPSAPQRHEAMQKGAHVMSSAHFSLLDAEGRTATTELAIGKALRRAVKRHSTTCSTNLEWLIDIWDRQELGHLPAPLSWQYPSLSLTGSRGLPFRLWRFPFFLPHPHKWTSCRRWPSTTEHFSSTIPKPQGHGQGLPLIQSLLS